MRVRQINLRKLWLSLLLLVGATAIAIPGIQEIAADGDYVAKVGDTEYATIEEAIAAWGPGKTLTLLADVTTTSTVTVEVTNSTQCWTLNLGNYTWTASGCNAFKLNATGVTPIHQNARLIINANQSGGITAQRKYAIQYTDDKNCSDSRGYRPGLYINGGTYNASYVVYYGTSAFSSTKNGASVFLNKSADGTEPIFNGDFGLSKCPVTVNAGYFNGTRFTVYRVSSTVDPCIYGGHFKTYSAFPVPGNDKGIVFGNYKVFVRSDASIDMTNGAPATYEAKATKTLLLSENQSVAYSDYIYYEKANDAIKKYSSGTIEIVLAQGVTATENKSFSSGTLTIDASAEGSEYTGNITLTSNNAKFIIKFPEGGGHYGVGVSSGGTLHVEETVADGIVTRTYSRIGTVSDPEAKVGDNGYSTVYDAFYAVDGTTDNKTIVLQKDVTNAGIITNGTATGGDGKTVATFDLNGKSIGIGSVAAGNNADYTLTIIDSSQDKTGTVTNSDASLFILALTGINDYSGSYTLKIQAGTWQFDPSNVVINGETHNLVDEGYAAKDNGDGTWTVGKVSYVAQIGTKKYVSLAAAVTDAQANDVITMIADDNVSLTAAGSEITINKSLTITGATAANGEPLYTISGNSNGTGTNDIFITGSGTVTLSNLRIKNFGNNAATDINHAPVYVSTNFTGNVKLENVYISDFNRGGIFLYGGTFDVDGCYIDCANSKSGAFTKGIEIKGSANGTIQNTVICNMERSSATYSTAGIEIYGNGSILVDNCTIISDNGTHQSVKGTYGIVSSRVGAHDPSGGSLQVKDCMFNCTNACLSIADDDTYGPVNNYSITVDGCDFDNYIATWSASSSITINSGSYSEDVYADAGSIIIKGGEFSSFAPDTGENGSIEISGGVFDKPVPEKYCAEGFIPADNTNAETLEDYPYSVKSGAYVAQIGEGNTAVKYETLEAAIEAATTGQTITLLADIDTEAQVEVGKQVTLDLNGKTIEYKGSTTLTSGVLMVLRGGDLTVTDSSEGAAGAIKSGTNAYAAIALTKAGETGTEIAKLTVNNGNLEGYYYAITGNGSRHGTDITIAGGVIKGICEGDNVGIFHPQDGTLTITGGTISGASGVELRSGTLNVTGGTITATADSYSYTANGSGTTTVGAAIAIAQHNTGKDITANITGATLSGTKLISVVDTQNNNLENVKVTASDNYIENTAIPADFKWVAAQTEGMSTLAKKTYVAQIGDEKYESLAAAVAAVPADGTETTITMIADANPVGINGATIETTQNVKLDLNGKTIALNINQAKASQLITNRGTLTIVDSSEEKTGKLTNTAAEGVSVGNWPEINFATNIITNSGTINVEGGTIQNTAHGNICYAVDNNSTSYDAILNIIGGTLTSYGTAVRQFCNSTTKQNVINMTGGVVISESDDAIWTQLPGSSATSKKLATLNISGGELTGVSYAWDDYSFGDSFEAVEYTITGGKYTGPLKSNAVINGVKPGFISGGLFSEEVKENYCAEGYIPTANTDEATKEAYPYTVKQGAYVAQIGEGESATKYETLEAAIEAATAGQTITLLADIDTEVQIEVGKQVTLDLNGKTIEYKGSTTLTSGVLMVLRGGDLTVTDSSEGAAGAIKSGTNAYAAIALTKAGETGTEIAKLTVNNGNLEGYYYAITGNGSRHGTDITIAGGVIKGICEGDNVGIFHPQDGTLTITGGTISGASGVELRSGTLNVTGGTITATADSYSYTANGSGTTTVGAAIAIAQHNTGKDITANITGATLSGTKLISVVDTQNNNLENVKVTASDNYIENTAIPADFKWVAAQTEGMSTLAKKTYVAQIGDEKYESLAAAVAAVPNGSETIITMIANEMINVVGSAITIPTNKNVVIDLNGFQVVGTAEGGSTSALITNKGTLTIKDSSDTNKDGTGTGKLISGATTTWIYEGDGNYAGSYASNTITNSGTLTIESGYVENLSTGSATYAVDNNSSGGNAILNVNGGLLKARAVAVRQFANSTTLKNEVNVAGGTVTAGYSGIWIQLPNSDATKAVKATLNVTGGTLTGGSYAFYDTTEGNSYDATQYNLSGGTFNGDIFSFGANINITGGTYNGEVAVKQTKPSTVAVSGGKFGGDVYTYGDNASEGFITGGIFAINTYEYEGNTYDCDWLYCLADGYIPTANTDPETKDAYPYAVRQANYICAIGTTKYETLQDAVNAAGTTASNITLLTDAATEGVITGNGVKVEKDQNITFDLNGLTYNVDKTVGSSGTETNGFQLLKGSTVKFTNGTVTSNTAQILLQNYSELTLDGVNVNAGSADYAVSNNFGSLTVTGGTNINANSGGCAFDLWYGMYAVYDDGISVVFDENFTGSVTGKVEYGHHSRVTDENWRDKTKLEIKAGKFDIEFVNSSTDALNGANISISGGIFAKKPAEEYCADGYVATDNTDEATMAQYPYTVKSKEEAGVFELIDGKVYPYLDYNEDKPAESVSYFRTFKNQNWQSLYIPFDINDVTKLADKYEFAKVHMVAYETDDNGVVSSDRIRLYYIPITSGTIYANKPYLIKLKNKEDMNKQQEIKVEKTTLYKTQNINDDPMKCSTTNADYLFKGTYRTDEVTAVPNDPSTHFFGVGGGGISYISNNTLSSYRWYIKVDPKDVNYAKPTIEFVMGDEDVTGISNIDSGDKSEIDGYYTINGVRSEVPVRGMNIVKYKNGKTKKVMIK